MKKFACTILISIALSLLITTYIVARPVSAVVDFDAYAGAAIPDGSIDGSIGTEWNDAGHYTNVAIDPSGTAEIWTKNDGTYLYIALKFTADSSDPWLAFQLGPTGCMTSNDDGAIFGDNSAGFSANGYTDAFFGGVGSVSPDATQNGVGAMTVGGANLVTVELKTPLSSGDTAGHDIAWAQGNQYVLVIAWDSNGGGSSGGSANHTGGTTPTARNILIDPNAIPEFSGWIIIAALIIITVPVIVLARKIIPKPPRKL